MFYQPVCHEISTGVCIRRPISLLSMKKTVFNGIVHVLDTEENWHFSCKARVYVLQFCTCFSA